MTDQVNPHRGYVTYETNCALVVGSMRQREICNEIRNFSWLSLLIDFIRIFKCDYEPQAI